MTRFYGPQCIIIAIGLIITTTEEVIKVTLFSFSQGWPWPWLNTSRKDGSVTGKRDVYETPELGMRQPDNVGNRITETAIQVISG